jgi:hypothetical protein
VRSAIFPFVLPLLITGGCVRQAKNVFEVPTHPTGDDSAPVPSETRDVVVASDAPSEEASEPVPAGVRASPRHEAPDPVLFRLGAGYGALGQLDLAPCRDQGLPPGYLHMRVTFRQSGRVVRAAVESPVAPPPEALACIGEQLEAAMVPLFEGSDVTLSKSFFIN